MGCLVLSRRLGESVIIDGDIVVTVSGIRGGQVKLAFNAPREKEIIREELLNARGDERKGSG